jgi:lysine/ornithine N-monooxygenase
MGILDQVLKSDELKEGLQKGEQLKLVSQVITKVQGGKSAAEIAKELVQDQAAIEKIINAVKSNPKLDAAAICNLLKK